MPVMLIPAIILKHQILACPFGEFKNQEWYSERFVGELKAGCELCGKIAIFPLESLKLTQ